MVKELDLHKLLAVAIEEARLGLAEGGIPIGAALFDSDGSMKQYFKDNNRVVIYYNQAKPAEGEK